MSPFLFAVYVDDLAKSCVWTSGIYIVLYADDILLIAPTVCELQKLLHVCEQELRDLDMSINVQKTCCLRAAPGITLRAQVFPRRLALQYHG